jgi:BMFP domain-containing protein YqiC
MPDLMWLVFAGLFTYRIAELNPGRKPLCRRSRRPKSSRSKKEYLRDHEMQSDNKIFDDFVKLVNGAAGTIAGMGREAESGARARAKEWIGGLDFVSRDEFEAVKAMAAAARDDADALRARLDALESKAAAASPAAPRKPKAGA